MSLPFGMSAEERVAQLEAAIPGWRERVEELTSQVIKAEAERDQRDKSIEWFRRELLAAEKRLGAGDEPASDEWIVYACPKCGKQLESSTRSCVSGHVNTHAVAYKVIPTSSLLSNGGRVLTISEEAFKELDRKWSRSVEACIKDDELWFRIVDHEGSPMDDKKLETVVDFLGAWRYCPVSEASNPSRACLEDAAKQLLDALSEDTEMQSGGGEGS
jgi:hypothetical protein